MGGLGRRLLVGIPKAVNKNSMGGLGRPTQATESAHSKRHTAKTLYLVGPQPSQQPAGRGRWTRHIAARHIFRFCHRRLAHVPAVTWRAGSPASTRAALRRGRLEGLASRTFRALDLAVGLRVGGVLSHL